MPLHPVAYRLTINLRRAALDARFVVIAQPHPLLEVLADVLLLLLVEVE